MKRVYSSCSRLVNATILSGLLWLAVPQSAHGDLIITTLDYPGATATCASGINDHGVVVGYYQSGGVWHSFVYNAGIYTSFDVPVANTFQQMTGINNAGDISGRYSDVGGVYHSFLLSGGLGGTYSTLDAPGFTNTMAIGLNDRQAGGYGGSGPVLVGQVSNSDWSVQYGFFLDASGYNTFQYTTEETSASSINNNNQIFGGHYASGWQGLLRAPDGTLTPISYPGAGNTYAGGINDLEVLTGGYIASSVTHGYYRDLSGFHTVDVPGATLTAFNDVNNNNVAVGYYTAGGVDHGVIVQVPEPATLSLLVLAGLTLVRQRRR